MKFESSFVIGILFRSFLPKEAIMLLLILFFSIINSFKNEITLSFYGISISVVSLEKANEVKIFDKNSFSS